GISQRGQECFLAREFRGHELELSLPLDEDLIGPIDHYLADARVVEVRPDWGEELKERLFEYGLGDHGTLLRSKARAVSACSPSGLRRMYSRNCASASSNDSPVSRSTEAR